MKFPITREALQSIDVAKEKKEINDLDIQIHIKCVVSEICQEIEKLILWEKPSDTLIDLFREQEFKHQKIINDKQFVWNGLKNITQPTFNSPTFDAEESVLIEILVEKLKETFIDCDIIIDPLKTYLIIDWS